MIPEWMKLVYYYFLDEEETSKSQPVKIIRLAYKHKIEILNSGAEYEALEFLEKYSNETDDK